MRLRLLSVLTALLAAVPAAAGIPEAVPNLPFAEAETAVGSIVTTAVPSVAPAPKTVDGDVSDWTGIPTRLGGTSIYSRGELVYQDYLGDAWGADDGDDAARLAVLDAAREAEPRTYRLDSLQQAAGDQFDAPRPVGAPLHYGDAAVSDDERNQADIEEVRVAADAENLYFLVRTLAMRADPALGILLLLDTEAGETTYALPDGLGGITTAAEWAFLVAGDDVSRIAYKGLNVLPGCTPGCEPFRVATNPDGYTNAMEIRIRRDFFDPLPAVFGLGVATGLVAEPAMPTDLKDVTAGDARSNLLNVAFRREPARIWMDRAQALALREGDIDAFLRPVDLDGLTGGATETFVQRPGYYEAIYVDSSTPVNEERTVNSYFQGPFQHYGMYLPRSWRPGGVYPAMFWMHYRGGHAHDAAAWLPGVLREFGDEPGMLVVTPSARGTSSWYTGRGMADFLDVWGDATARLSIDPDRVYLGGHSMGGWASYLLGLLMPDRWAASNPEDGLIVPGLWTGVAPPSDAQNGADAKAEFLYPLLDNARNLPYAILHGTLDELVPASSAVAISERFTELGYRHRLYLFHAYEHYSAPIWDDWREVVRTMTVFRRERDPERVTYTISPALDHAVSTISAPEGVDLGLKFDRAYWVSGLTTRTEGIDPSNIGRIDATTEGRGLTDVTGIPEAGAGGQAEPYTMTGWRWLEGGVSAPSNAFRVISSNIATATLDVARMALGSAERILGDVTVDGAASLTLAGVWSRPPTVSGASSAEFTPGSLTLGFDGAGSYTVVIDP